MRSRRTCCRRKVCPFWLARPPSERFCSDRSRTSGHCTSKGRLGSKLGFVGDALVPASHYIHPEFGFFCPIPRFHRRLRGALGGIHRRRDDPSHEPGTVRRRRPPTTHRRRRADHRGQAVLRRRHPDRRQLCFRQAAQATHGLGGERSPSNRCRCSRPQRRSNNGQHRCGASHSPRRLPCSSQPRPATFT